MGGTGTAIGQVLSGGLPAGAAARAVSSTAGLPSGGTPDLSGLPTNLGDLTFFAQNPQSRTLASPIGQVLTDGLLNPYQGANPLGLAGIAAAVQGNMNNPAGGSSGSPSTGPTGPTGPSLSDVLSSLIGSSAPSASDYFNPSTYQQAINAINGSSGAINGAYDQAKSSLDQLNGLFNQGYQNTTNQLNADESAAADRVNGFAQQAQQLAGQGGQLGARMAALQAMNAQQAQGQQALNTQLQGVGQWNQAHAAQGLAVDRQAALDAATAASNKVAAQEAAAAAKGQSSYSKATTSYQNAVNKYLSEAQKGAQSSGQLGGKDWARQTGGPTGAWAQAGARGDGNAQALANATTNLLDPSHYGGKAPTFQQAATLLAQSAPSLGGTNSVEYGIVNNWLQNYFGASNQNLMTPNDRQQAYADWLVQNR